MNFMNIDPDSEMNQDLTILSPQILSDVFGWSPTQRRKIDKHLSIRCREFWPKGTKDELTFYKVLIDSVDEGQGKDIFSALDQLVDKVGRKKKIPFILMHYIRRMNDLARKSDPDSFSSLMESGESNFINLLSVEDRIKFETVEKKFIDVVFDVYGEDELIEPTDQERWKNELLKTEELCHIASGLLIGLSAGNDENYQEVKQLIDEIYRKGNELKKEIEANFKEFNFDFSSWNNGDELREYLDNFASHMDRLQSESEVIKEFYQNLYTVVHNINIQARTRRKQKKLEGLLAKVEEEILSQFNIDEPAVFPGPKNPKEWFDWALQLNQEELDKAQNFLDDQFPSLADFLDECEPEWLLSTSESHHKNEESKEPDLAESIHEKIEQDSPLQQAEQEQPPLLNTEGTTTVDSPTEVINPIQENDAEVGTSGQETQKNDKPSDLSKNSAQSEERLCRQSYEDLLHRGEFAKAYWVSTQCIDCDMPQLIGAVALGSQVGIGSQLPEQLLEFFEYLVTVNFDSVHSKLLLFSAITGSALFVDPPVGEIATLIRLITTGIEAIDKLANDIATKFLYQGALQFDDVSSVISDDLVEKRINELQLKSAELLEKIKASNPKYIPAKSFMRSVYSEGSDLVKIHNAVTTNDLRAVKEIHAIVGKISGETLVAEAHTAGIKGCSRPIVGPLRNQLVRHIGETIVLGKEWCSLVIGQDASEGGHDKNKVEQLRVLIIQAIQAAKKINQSQTESTSAGVLITCLTRVQEALNGQSVSSVNSLESALLNEASLELDDDFHPFERDKNKFFTIFNGDEKQGDDYYQTLLLDCVNRCEFLRAKEIIETNELGQEHLELIEIKMEQEVDRLRKRLRPAADRVEDAYLLGQLFLPDGDPNASQDKLRTKFIGILTEVESALREESDTGWYIRKYKDKIKQIETTLDAIEVNYQEKINDDFQKIIDVPAKTEEEANDREYVKTFFKEAMDQGDSIVALELLNRTREASQSGTAIPRSGLGKNEELDHFLSRISQYQSILGKKSKLLSYIAAILKGKPIGNIEFRWIDKANREKAAAGMTAWQRLLTLDYKQAKDEIQKHTLAVCDFLGLNIDPGCIEGKSAVEDDLLWVRVTLKYPVDSSPVPRFGSLMGKHVDIVLSKNKKEPNQLYSFLKRHDLQMKPVLLFYMQEMGLNQRLTFQRFCTQQQLPLLVVDLCVMFHLCGVKNRLPELFKVTLPFSYDQPYMMKGENVPAEIFVGREKEVKSLLSPEGSCIVYGGRQLGKSALLRHLYKTYNNPDRETFIIYTDIDNLGLDPQTHEQMVEQFWRKVHRNLVREEFLDPNSTIKKKKSNTIEEEVSGNIINTLQEHPGRKIYLLLDETDNFLDRDSEQNFSVIRRLRAMMATTDRRFKVVLAGLQSVQRYQNWKNHPFAQLGTDLVIDPLNPEAAQKLILQPMNALGFVFEKNGLILRILSQANYHPGLIQIFCHRLVERVTSRGNQGGTSDVIRKIRQDDLQAIERDPNFKEDIRNRFDWTLDLDDRYKVIIYALVLEYDKTGARTERNFYSLSNSWWPIVFEKMDQQSFRAVLDELVGLGVLVREDDGGTRRYRLRSPNLLRLLGTKEQIEDELERIVSREKPRTLNSRNFHPKISKKPLRYGPMTIEQEGQIAKGLEVADGRKIPFSLTVITGSDALGLNEVSSQIDAVFENIEGEHWRKLVVAPAVSADAEKVMSFVGKNLKPRKRDHSYVVIDCSLLPIETSISKLVYSIMECCSKICRAESRGRVFVLVPSLNLWNLLAEPEYENLLEFQGVNFINLRRWSDGAVVNLLSNMKTVLGGKTAGEEVFKVTSGWHMLIQLGIDQQVKQVSKAGEKTEVIRAVWADKTEMLLQEAVDDPVKKLQLFGLIGEDSLVPTLLEGVFSLAQTDDVLTLTKEVFDVWRDENNDTVSQREIERFKNWLKFIDVVYRDEANRLLVDPLVAKCFSLYIEMQDR